MNSITPDIILEAMRDAALSSGNLMRNSTPEERMNICSEDDMITMIDLKADNLIRQMLLDKFPDINILTEETCKSDPNYKPESLSDFTGFLVDPIDGSVNFSRTITPNYGNYAVSIGYSENGIPTIGVIYKPLEDEMYHAVRGDGAFLNGLPIRVSEIDSFQNSAIELGSFWIRENIDMFRKWFTNLDTDVNQILIRGSAAAALADVARGRIEAMLHSRLNAWDYAAGWVIIEEAGGVVMNGDTSPLILGSRFIYATNKNLNNSVAEIIRSCQI